MLQFRCVNDVILGCGCVVMLNAAVAMFQLKSGGYLRLLSDIAFAVIVVE